VTFWESLRTKNFAISFGTGVLKEACTMKFNTENMNSSSNHHYFNVAFPQWWVILL
jgi:glycine cleavage system protein P-like pyridoxal-binding family